MKKILALALSALMLFAFCACGTPAETVAETTAEVVDNTTAEVVDNTPDTEKKVFRVAMECAYAPYNWAQETDANGAVAIADTNMFAYGYDVIIAKKIAEENNWDLEIVKLDWDSLIPALQAGTVDAVIAGQSITADRLEQVDFSTPYYYATIVTLVKNDSAFASATSIADLKGATGTSQLGTIWYDHCLGQIPEVNMLPAQETAPNMLVALNAGTCDVVVTDRPTGEAALVAYDNFKLLDFYGTEGDYTVSDEDINIGISVQKGNTEMLDAINAVLATMTASDFNDLMAEAISVQPLAE
ncbi:MAG: transporter substrate-binding domain-containing protein [Ruminococcaceae bacterium]|nr:transporter substrate-binding domain-containing protein [Oscillospiraceae bacterium]